MDEFRKFKIMGGNDEWENIFEDIIQNAVEKKQELGNVQEEEEDVMSSMCLYGVLVEKKEKQNRTSVSIWREF